MKRLVILCIILFSAVPGLLAQEDDVSAAAQAYKDGNYEQALDLYDKLLKEHPEDADLLHNLGNVHYRLGNTGESILYYKRALKFDPSDKDTRHNLSLARERKKDEFEKVPEFFVLSWWKAISSKAGIGSWSLFALLSGWLSVGGLAVYLFAERRTIRKAGFYGGISLIAISLLCLSARIHLVRLAGSDDQAVLLAPSVSVKSEPVRGSKDLYIIHEGAELRILDSDGPWHKVRLENGSTGWLPEEAFEII